VVLPNARTRLKLQVCVGMLSFAQHADSKLCWWPSESSHCSNTLLIFMQYCTVAKIVCMLEGGIAVCSKPLSCTHRHANCPSQQATTATLAAKLMMRLIKGSMSHMYHVAPYCTQPSSIPGCRLPFLQLVMRLFLFFFPTSTSCTTATACTIILGHYGCTDTFNFFMFFFDLLSIRFWVGIQP